MSRIYPHLGHTQGVMTPTVSILLDHQVAGQYEAATVDALGHAQQWLGTAVEMRLIPTRRIDNYRILRESAGVAGTTLTAAWALAALKSAVSFGVKVTLSGCAAPTFRSVPAIGV